MSLRPFASGTISFSLVTIPVKLFSTGESASGVQLSLLHKKCRSRLKQQYFCPVDEEVVGRDDIVKGYEYAEGQYVLFSEEELKALNSQSTNTIEITEFVPAAAVDPIYIDKSYYLGPDKTGDRSYLLLAEAMKSTERVALARYAARGKDYLVLLRPYSSGLLMQQLRYQEELRPFSEVPIGTAEIREPELKLAAQLIEQITNDRFEPERYKDTVRQRTLELIEKKVQGQEIVTPPAEASKAQVVDLMAALKASLLAQPEASHSAPTQHEAPAPLLASRKPPKRAPRRAAREAAEVTRPKPKRARK